MQLKQGDKLRAEFTGKVYTVRQIEDGKVYVFGLPPVSERQVKRDIENGKITKL